MSFAFFGRLRAVLLAALLVLLVPRVAAAQSERPNIILIITDDQGYGDLGVTGNPVLRTPHLDALAAGSARIEPFYVSPVCAPTRASLLTGRYNYRTRVVDTYLGRAMMEPEEVTLAEVLGGAGYATGIFGKWHLGDLYPMRPMDQGFEEVLVHRGGGIGQPSDPPGGEGRYTDPILFHNGEAVQARGYCTDVYFDAAMDWIDRAEQADRPFFVYLPTNAPHSPYHDVPEDLYAYYRSLNLGPHLFPDDGYPLPDKADADVLARVFAMIENVDMNVGRLMRHLEQRGIGDNTIVIFMTDNGPNTRRYVAGLRGMKSDVYEGGIRSPFFVRWPARLQAGRIATKPAAHIDVMPTLLEAAGVAPPEGLHLDGRSVLPLLEGRAAGWPDRTLFIQIHRGDEPVRYHHFAARGPRWKLLQASGFRHHGFTGPPRFELYDLEQDPYEQHDVAAAHPDVVESMRRTYEAWFDDVSRTRPDNFAPPRIHVGTPHEDPAVLTRQDWRYGGEDGGWDRDAFGFWLLHVADGGPYDVHVRFDPDEAAGTLLLQAGGQTFRRTVAQRAGEAVFEDVRLPVGDVRLDAVLSHDDRTRGVHQIELKRLP